MSPYFNLIRAQWRRTSLRRYTASVMLLALIMTLSFGDVGTWLRIAWAYMWVSQPFGGGGGGGW